MSTLNAALFIPTTQKGNLPQQYKGVDDSTTAAQFALIKAGAAGTDGVLNGVTARWGQYGAISYTDVGGNYILASPLTDSFGNPGGKKNAVVSVNLGVGADDTTTAVHAAITMPVANSTSGVHAAITLTTASQTITTAITNKANRHMTITGNDTDMLGPVTINGTDYNDAVISETLQLNGTTTVEGLLGFKTTTSIVVPPYTVDGSETVIVGMGDLVTVASITNPDIPRAVSITGSAGSITSVQTINGTDIEGTAISETITANGTSTVNGKKAFKTVTSIFTGAQNAGGDTMAIGVADILGLPYRMDHDAVLAAQFGATHEATRPTVTYDALNISGNTVLLNSDLDGSKSVIVDFIRCDAPLEFDRF